MCLGLYVGMYTLIQVPLEDREVMYFQKLQYQEATSCLMWVLGNKLPLEEEYVLNPSIPK